ncbi:hypothetical protein [Brevibacillus dissolubilis]|uniref:hypothetical protein n=1 Tax=Brevibacillus dissolubilis TaxID=1844116 RepID=UPI0011179FF7|nr:hypothetical protein [Brevibacillus dissolubilis]
MNKNEKPLDLVDLQVSLYSQQIERAMQDVEQAIELLQKLNVTNSLQTLQAKLKELEALKPNLNPPVDEQEKESKTETE